MQFSFGGFSISLNELSILIWATFKDNNMLPMGEVWEHILFFNKSRTLDVGFSTLKHTIQKLMFAKMDTSILRA